MVTGISFLNRGLIVQSLLFVVCAMALSCTSESVALAQYGGGGYGNTYNNGGGYGNSYGNDGGYGNSYGNGGGYGNSYDNGGGYGYAPDNGDGGYQQAPAGGSDYKPVKHKKTSKFWTWFFLILCMIGGYPLVRIVNAVSGGRLNDGTGGAVDYMKSQQGNNQNFPPNQGGF